MRCKKPRLDGDLALGVDGPILDVSPISTTRVGHRLQFDLTDRLPVPILVPNLSSAEENDHDVL